MNETEFNKFNEAAMKLQQELNFKTAKAQQIIQESNDIIKKINAAREELKKRTDSVTLREKKVKYIQLRLMKILSDKKIDAVLKDELEKAMAE